jgi:biotin transport system substrate-specific component
MRVETRAQSATLIGAIWPHADTRGLLRVALLAIAGAALLTLAAKIKVPFYPVPMTLQTLAIAVIAASFGARLAAITVLLYLAQGMLGLPVFTNTPPAVAGLAYMTGPTGGYLVGFVAAALLVGHLAERGWDRSLPVLFAAMMLGDAVILACGTGWLAFGVGMGLDKALQVGLYPFLLAALLKEALGAALIRSAWTLVRRLRGI